MIINIVEPRYCNNLLINYYSLIKSFIESDPKSDKKILTLFLVL